MKKILSFLLLTLLVVLPLNVKASSCEDQVYSIVNDPKPSTPTIYFFHSNTCPHCHDLGIVLDDIEKDYGKKLIIKRYEVSNSMQNSAYLKAVRKHLGEPGTTVPYLVVGDKTFLGYSSAMEKQIRSTIKDYSKQKCTTGEGDVYTIPLLGEIDAASVSIPFVAIVLGVLDGFNPCAMWILLFLINMLFNMKDKKKMWILGFTFLFTSAFVYFLAMLGLSIVLGFTAVTVVRNIIALVAIIGGALNLKAYLTTPKDGCHVVDDKKRKKYFNKIKAFTNEQNLLLALAGVIVLAASVNLVELACSAGFPAIFVSILEFNNIGFIGKLMYILLYIIFFLIDDILVFVIAMRTLSITGITTKYNRLSHLIGGIIMLIIGALLIFKPEWIMFNF